MKPKPVILVCAGPSLGQCNVLALFGIIPIAAISTAVRITGQVCDFWFFTDPLSKDYGDDNGVRFLLDSSINKIVPIRGKTKDIINNKKYRSITGAEYSSSEKKDVKEGRYFMDGKLPILRSKHLTLLFAIQWLIQQGFNQLIFAGVDLKTTIQQPRAWGKYDHDCRGDMKQAMVDHQNECHDKLLAVLREWYEVAKSKGVEFLSWSPGSRINEFMPAFSEYAPPAAVQSPRHPVHNPDRR